MGRSHGLVGGLLATMVLVLGAGCADPSRPRGSRIDVGEHDFTLTASSDRVPAGWVTFRIHNSGPSTHAFNVDQTALAADSLPLQRSSLQVNEASRQVHRVGSVSQVRFGATRELTVRLAPGHYVIYCNLEGHYLGGMHFAFAVTT